MLNKMLKLRNKKGFTLMEMLIVVAIIAILIAIAIPTFNSSMNKARVSTDAANIQSAYSLMLTMKLMNQNPAGAALPTTGGAVTYHFTTAGTLDTTGTNYTCAGDNTGTNAVKVDVAGIASWAKGNIITVVYNPTATTEATMWEFTVDAAA